MLTNAFEGHKGEDDEVFRYQVLTLLVYEALSY